MYRSFVVSWALVTVVALGGCASTKGLSEMEADHALVLGYIDMDEAPASRLTAFSLRQVMPKSDKPFWHMRTHDGVFYLENLPFGSYQLNQFGGPGGFLSNVSFYWFDFPRQNEGFRITKPGVYYAGSFKYKKAGTFFRPKFELQTVNSPGEREAIEKILEYSKNTKWEAQLRRRLAQLSGSAQK